MVLASQRHLFWLVCRELLLFLLPHLRKLLLIWLIQVGLQPVLAEEVAHALVPVATGRQERAPLLAVQRPAQRLRGAIWYETFNMQKEPVGLSQAWCQLQYASLSGHGQTSACLVRHNHATLFLYGFIVLQWAGNFYSQQDHHAGPLES